MTAAAYDALAPHFVAYARSRAAYCDAVDRVIVSRARSAGGSWLDVGSGDGGRAVRLARALMTTRLVLSDPSEAMAALCRRQPVSEVWQCAAEELPAGVQRFDVITCLWNVLGHVDGRGRRVAALRRMAALLMPRGQMFFDVHNRYNARTAGLGRVVGRVIRDRVVPAETNGSVTFDWTIDGTLIPSKGYLFTEAEVRHLCAAAGLCVVRHQFVDYATGDARSWWGGQMVFEVASGES